MSGAGGMPQLARLFMAMGALLFLAGLLIYMFHRFGIPFGKLPGDVSWQGRNVRVFAPITSMIIVSIVLTVILNLISRFGGK